MRATDITGLPVQPEGTDDVTGTVSDIVLDAEERRAVAIIVTRAENETLYVLDVGDIVTVDDRGVRARRDAEILPLSDARQYDSTPSFGRMLEEKAMTESGRVLGKLTDLDLDTSSWKVTGYEIADGYNQVLEHGEQCLSPDQLVSAGAHLLLVRDAVDEMPEATEGQ